MSHSGIFSNPREAIKAAIQNLFPGMMAVVMATGILAIASHLIIQELILSQILFILCVVIYLVLFGMNLTRVIKYPDRVISEFRSPLGAGFLTWVASTAIVGTGFLTFDYPLIFGRAFYFLAFCLWIFLAYKFIIEIFFNEQKPAVENSMTGAWLLLVVSTQSLSILALKVSIAPGALYVEAGVWISLMLHLIGAFFYLAVSTLLLAHIAHSIATPKSFTPVEWLWMGAAAISALTAAQLANHEYTFTALRMVAPVLRASAFFFWSVATWWIPLLIYGGIWRHLLHKTALSYEPRLWSMVFPLGMYTAASFHIGVTSRLSFFLGYSRVFYVVAALCWVIVFVSMMKKIITNK